MVGDLGFAETGVVRCPAAFDPDAAAQMAGAVWAYAGAKIGVRPDDPETWPKGWPEMNWKGLRRDPVFDPVFANESVRRALDAVFAPTGWTPPKSGAQLLVTFPNAEVWTMPDGWHMDAGFERATWPVFAVKLFAFFGPVGARGGGTMLLPGTHRLVDRYRERLPEATGGGYGNWRPFLEHHPFLAEVLHGGEAGDGGRGLVGRTEDVDGVPVTVEELTGEPGDVVITHLHVFHSASPNAGPVPRQMLGKAIYAAGRKLQ